MSGAATSRTHAARHLVPIGLGTGLLYAVTYVIQRAIFPALWKGATVVESPDRAMLLGLAGLYALATIGLFVLFARVLRLAANGLPDDTRGRLLILAFPVAFTILMAAGRTSLSIDVLSYIGHGHQATVGQSPYGYAVKDLAPTPFGRDLIANGWLPVHGASPYGPLWTSLELIVARVGSGALAQAAIIKMVVAAASLSCAYLIWTILGVVSPGHQLLGTVLYLWNPVIVMELAGDGHNDAIVIAFLLLSLLLAVRQRPGFSILALTFGALVKITVAMFAPLYLLYWWRTQGDRKRLVVGIAAAAAVGLAITAAMYAPFWVGRSTLTGLHDHSHPGVMPSTPGALLWYLSQTYSEETAARALSVATAGVFLICFTIFAVSVVDARTLVKACGYAALAYLLLAPAYWPWYAAMPVALLALAPDAAARWAVLAISLGARLAAPLDALRLAGLMDWPTEVIATTLVGLWLPMAFLLMRSPWRTMHWVGFRPLSNTVAPQ